LNSIAAAIVTVGELAVTARVHFSVLRKVKKVKGMKWRWDARIVTIFTSA